MKYKTYIKDNGIWNGEKEYGVFEINSMLTWIEKSGKRMYTREIMQECIQTFHDEYEANKFANQVENKKYWVLKWYNPEESNYTTLAELRRIFGYI